MHWIGSVRIGEKLLVFRAYKCPKCPAAFKRSDHLQSHLRHRHKNDQCDENLTNEKIQVKKTRKRLQQIEKLPIHKPALQSE